jgi:hypothetical protein
MQYKSISEIMSVAEAIVKERKEQESRRELAAAGIVVDVPEGGRESATAAALPHVGNAALPPWLLDDAAPVAPASTTRRQSKPSAPVSARVGKASSPAPLAASTPIFAPVEPSRRAGGSVVSGGGGTKRKAASPSPIVLSTVAQSVGKHVPADSASLVSGRSGKSLRTTLEVGASASSAGHAPTLVIEDLMAGIGDKRAVNGVAE